MSCRSSASERNFAVGERQPSPSRNAQTRPFAPSSCARSIRPSSSERGSSRAPALSPRTTPPDSITPLKTLNSVSAQGVARGPPARGRNAGRGGRCRSATSPRRRAAASSGSSSLGPPTALEHVGQQPLVDVDHVLDADERHLDVELGEVGLAVGAQVLVAEAAGDLVVALEARDHQQLLEELRRLRQRVERPGAGAGSGRGSRARPPAWSGSASASRSRGTPPRRGTRASRRRPGGAARSPRASARGAGRGSGGAGAPPRRPRRRTLDLRMAASRSRPAARRRSPAARTRRSGGLG